MAGKWIEKDSVEIGSGNSGMLILTALNLRGRMGIFKKVAIKGVTKKRTHQMTDLVDVAISNRDMVATVDDMQNLIIEVMQGYSLSVQIVGGYSLIQDSDLNYNWKEIMFIVVSHLVKSELSYDSTFGTEKDYDLVMECFEKELTKWRDRKSAPFINS